MSFSGKVVLVTGASSGIGAATAVLFAGEGARVALVARNEAKLSNVAQQCAARGAQPLVIIADVANEDEAKTIVNKTIEQFGQLDLLVNNAGMFKPGTILDGDILEAYDAIMEINVRAVIRLTCLATPHLVQSKGNIINVSSVGSLFTSKLPHQAAYNVSKAALDHFTRAAALELAASGVRVNCVNPGPVRTDLLSNAGIPTEVISWEKFRKATALGRCGEPEEIADLILFLASDKAKSITGSTYVSDNGLLLKA